MNEDTFGILLIVLATFVLAPMIIALWIIVYRLLAGGAL